VRGKNPKIINNDLLTYGFATSGIYAEESPYLYVDSNMVRTGGDDCGVITIWESPNSTLRKNMIASFGDNDVGIILSKSQKSEIINNEIITRGSGGRGIQLMDNSNLNVVNNRITIYGDNANGLLLFFTSNSHIYDNSFTISSIDSYGLIIEGELSLNYFSSSSFGVEHLSSYEIFFRPFSFGVNNFINMNLHNDGIRFDPKSNAALERSWYLLVDVNGPNGKPLKNTLVSAYSVTNNLVFSEYTNEEGVIPRQTLLSYTQTRDSIEYAYPYTVRVSKEGYIPQERTFDLDRNVSLEFVLERER
jgi:hypothetical protein